MSNSTQDKIVTIFGGSKCDEESEEYRQALELGRLLAERGYTICTGGYLGVMEGASRGARERGGHVLGIVMNQFKSEPNRYLTDKVASAHFYERLQNLIERSVGFIALRGGAGTVTEMSLVWNKLQTRVIEPRPLALLGDCWAKVIESFRENLVVSEQDVSLLSFVKTPEEAVRVIEESVGGMNR
jgi:uncharacterized protein (TIGR00730 family)